jgi:hypothetical protein
VLLQGASRFVFSSASRLQWFMEPDVVGLGFPLHKNV